MFGAHFDSSMTGGNRGYARVCSAEHDSPDWKSLCTVQLPHGDTGRVEGLVCAQVDAASLYDHETEHLLKNSIYYYSSLLLSTLLVHSPAFFPKPLLIFPVLVVANTWFLCRPAE